MTSPADYKDVFEFFHAAHGAGVVADPYPRWAEQRAESPVHEGDLDPMGIGSSLFGDRTLFTVLSYDVVAEVLRDPDRFSSDLVNDYIGPVLGRVILGMNPVDHRLHRGIVQEAFSRRVMRDWMPNIVRVVDTHIAAFEDRGHADLVTELAFSFPVYVIAELLGLPSEDLAQFHQWAVEMNCLPYDPELGMAGSAKLAAYFVPLIAARRAEPRDDMISVLTSAQVEGRSLEDQEIVDYLRFLLEAGAETTYRSLSNLLFGLLANPEVLEEVRSNRELLPQATEEALRWEPPLTTFFRGAERDTELAGVRIPEGAVVAVNVGAADRDESRWENPDVFDIHRPPLAHHAFGFGAHICLGMHLARLEMIAALDAVLDRLPNVRLDPAAENVAITGSTFRTPVSLPVVFDRR